MRGIVSRVALTLSVVTATLVLGSVPPLVRGDASPGEMEFFEMKIRPVLAENCYPCHSTEVDAMAGLRLDSKASLLKGGSRGPAIVPGEPEKSLLIQAVSYRSSDLKMPPTGKISDEQIADLTAWIKMGAPDPRTQESVPAAEAEENGIDFEQGRKFWSFQPVQDYPLPSVKQKDWPTAPIDYFILAKLEEKGLSPVPPADKRTLIRRASFDLIGLPPSPEEVDAFVGDSSPDAFARVVDRLLASPHYGERWGRYWLDVARYADDKLNSVMMDPYPHAYRYRDWVIQAFHEDMPYDRFVKAQIAGDLLEGVQRESVGGLGFFALSPQFQDDRIDATTRGFLALSVACAQCHDHKFDPISTEDYYALLGVFNSTKTDEYPLSPQEVVEEYQSQKKKVDAEEGALKEFLKTQSRQLVDILARRTSSYMVAAWQVLGPPKGDLQEAAQQASLDRETLERWVKYLGNSPRKHPLLDSWDDLLRRGAAEAEVRRFADETQELLVSLIREKKEIDEKNKIRLGGTDTFSNRAETETLSLERNRYFFWRDLASGKEDVIMRDFEGGILYYDHEKIDRFLEGVWKDHLTAMQANIKALKDQLPPKYPFLHVISDVEEPKNEHVHIRGDKDNLGDEVPRQFLTVLSDGEPVPFTQGSGRLELAEAIADPKNPLTPRVMVNRIWLHHFGQGIVRTPSDFGQMGNRPSHPQLIDYLARRLIENNWSIKAMHREIMLSATYRLSTQHAEKNFATDPDNVLFWRGNRRRLDAEALRDSLLYVAGNLDATRGGEPGMLTDEKNQRRSVYGYVSRRRLDTMLGLFDFPNPNSTSPQRIGTNTALQGLFFLNSELVMRQAKALASRLEKEVSGDNGAKIRRAYRLLFGREPTAEEMKAGREFLKPDPTEWPRFCQVLLVSNEFLYVN